MKYFILFLAFIIAGCSSSPKQKSVTDLEHEISNRLEQLEGTFAVAFQSLQDSSAQVFINPDERFHAASTMKTPVMIEIYKQAEEGKFSTSDSIQIHNEFLSIVDSPSFSMEVSEDSEQGLYENMGNMAAIDHLTYEMITRSSNLATNILIDFVGAKNVTQTMREIGADSIEVLRGVEDIKAYEAGLSNSTTARDLLIIFEELAKGDLLSESSRNEMIGILKDQKHNDMFPVKLPDSTEVAHKTGWITGVNHDSGIIYLPNGESFVLVFLSKNAPNREAVLDAAADIALMCYNYLDN